VTRLIPTGILAGFVEVLPRRCRLAVGDRFLAPALMNGLRQRLELAHIDPPTAVRYSGQSYCGRPPGLRRLGCAETIVGGYIALRRALEVPAVQRFIWHRRVPADVPTIRCSKPVIAFWWLSSTA
jgi:hypothetical protein